MSTVSEEMIWVAVSRTYPDLLLAESSKFLIEQWLEDQGLEFTTDTVCSAVVALGSQLPNKARPVVQAPAPVVVEETPKQELIRLAKECDSPNKEVAAAAKDRLKQLSNAGQPPKIRQLPPDVTSEYLASLGRNALTTEMTKYGSKQIRDRIRGIN